VTSASPITRPKQKASELVDAAFTLINEDNSKAACPYYLQALEEVGRFLMLKNWQHEPSSAIVTIEGISKKAKDARIEFALRHMKKSSSDSCLIENGTEFSVADGASDSELKMAIVALKSSLPFL